MNVGEVPPKPIYKKKKNKQSEQLMSKSEEQNECLVCKSKTQEFYVIDFCQKFICNKCANIIMLQRVSYLSKLK